MTGRQAGAPAGKPGGPALCALGRTRPYLAASSRSWCDPEPRRPIPVKAGMTKRRWWVAPGAVLVLVAGVIFTDQARLWWGSSSPEDEAERVAALAGVTVGQTVAEIGAGSGVMARVMAPKVLPGGRLIVTELNDARLVDLRSMAAAGNWQHVEVQRGESAGTALPPSCCSLIYLRHVFHHFGDPPAMARALHEAVAPGGRLVVIDFPPHWILGLMAPVTSGAGHAGAHGVTAEDVISHLRAAGFVLELQDAAWTAGSFMVMMRK